MKLARWLSPDTSDDMIGDPGDVTDLINLAPVALVNSVEHAQQIALDHWNDDMGNDPGDWPMWHGREKPTVEWWQRSDHDPAWWFLVDKEGECFVVLLVIDLEIGEVK